LNDFAGFLEMTFFLILLICSVYQIGKRIYNPDAGIFAAFCIAMFPIISEYSRDYMLDLPLAAMVAAAVYSLIRTNDFSSRNNCIKFGIMLRFGNADEMDIHFICNYSNDFFTLGRLLSCFKKIQNICKFFPKYNHRTYYLPPMVSYVI
jgi:predicted membrane-bound mannosyltransferase